MSWQSGPRFQYIFPYRHMSTFRVHTLEAANLRSGAQIRRTNSTPEGSQTRLLRWGLLQHTSPVIGDRSVASGLRHQSNGCHRGDVDNRHLYTDEAVA